MKLRPYQEEILDIAKKNISEKPTGRVIVQLPTGMGKTVVFSSLIRDMNRPALVLAHREELLTQARDKMVACGIDANDTDIVLQSSPDPAKKIHIASVQTLVRRDLAAIRPEIIIVDECHHTIASTYRKILDAYPNAPVIGFTATPTRVGKKEKEELGKMFDSIIYQYPIKKAILDGYLANIRYYQVKTDIGLDTVSIRGGDFSERELAMKVNAQARNRSAVEKYIELGGGKAIVFAVDCKHAEDQCLEFESAGIESYCILGSTKERGDVLGRFQKANINENIVLVNCMVLTEGFDAPNVRTVILARPTTSPIVYLQQLGRGTRIAPGKSEIVVIDIVDNCKKRELCNCLKTVFNLRKGVKIEGDILDRLFEKKAKRDGAKEPGLFDELADLDHAIEQENIELEIAKILFDMPEELERSTLAWFSPIEKEYHVQITKDLKLTIYDDMLNYSLVRNEYEPVSAPYTPDWFADRTPTEYRKKSLINELIQKSTDLAVLVAHAEHIATAYQQTSFMWSKKQRKSLSGSKPTDKQRELLKKFVPEVDADCISRETASQIIGAELAKREKIRNEPPTSKQLGLLRWKGVPPSEYPKTKGEATRMIAEIMRKKQEALSW